MPLLTIAKKAAGKLFGAYDLYWIVARELGGGDPGAARLPPGCAVVAIGAAERAQIAASPTPKLRSALRYAAAGADGFALVADGELLSVAHMGEAGSGWNAAIWRLAPGEVGLIDVITEEAARGRNCATLLLGALEPIYRARGKDRLVAHIWWNHRASLRSFEKAGWKRMGFSFRLQSRLLNLRGRIRLPFR